MAESELQAELIRKGLKPEDARELAARMGKEGVSTGDGHCSGLARKAEE